VYNAYLEVQKTELNIKY